METNDEIKDEETAPNDGNIEAEAVDLNQACAVNVNADRVYMDQSCAAVVKADKVHMDKSFALILSAEELEGDVKALFTPQSALIAGGLTFLGMMLFRRR